MILSLVAGIEQSPRRVVPLAKLKRKVSALSLRLCAVAIIISLPSDEKNSYLICLPHSSKPSPSSFAFFATSTHKTFTGTPIFSHSDITRASSASACSPLKQWFT